MTKKEWFDTHENVCEYFVTYDFGYVCHGVEYGIEDYAYIRVVVCGRTVSYHRVKLHYTDGDAYVYVNGVKLWMDYFLN